LNAEQIKKLRKARGESRQKFAEAVGVDRQTIYNWEKNVSHPKSRLQLRRLKELQDQQKGGGTMKT